MPELRGVQNKKTRLLYKPLFLCALVAVLLLGTTPSWGFRHLKEGESTPDFQLKDLQGNTHSIKKLKGNVTVILY